MFNRRQILTAIGASATLAACKPAKKAGDSETGAAGGKLFGSVEKRDDALDAIIDTSSKLEELAAGFTWSEGPVWDAKRGKLYFSDVPENTAYSWSEADGLGIFLKPSGVPETEQNELYGSEGSNGLIMLRDGRLGICNHGKRAVTAMDIDSKKDTPLITKYEGKLLNSPNDMVEHSDGTIFFTDPPYGLAGQDDSPAKQLPINGVYKLSKEGAISLIDGTMTRPNGIALSPDEKTIYVAQSDSAKQIIKHYALAADGSIADKGIFYDCQPLAGEDSPGLPDGMCVHPTGTIFATGPGGVLILSAEGTLLGRILCEKATANCCLGGPEGKTLFVTSSDRLGRISLKA